MKTIQMTMRKCQCCFRLLEIKETSIYKNWANTHRGNTRSAIPDQLLSVNYDHLYYQHILIVAYKYALNRTPIYRCTVQGGRNEVKRLHQRLNQQHLCYYFEVARSFAYIVMWTLARQTSSYAKLQHYQRISIIFLTAT